MKKLFIPLVVLFMACSNQKPDEGLAKNKASELFDLLKNHQYEEAQQLYSTVFQESESLEARIKRLQDIETAAGQIISYEFIESSAMEIDNETILILTYKLQCSKVNLTEKIGIIKEEGKYKILSQEVTNK